MEIAKEIFGTTKKNKIRAKYATVILSYIKNHTELVISDSKFEIKSFCSRLGNRALIAFTNLSLSISNRRDFCMLAVVVTVVVTGF